MKSPSQAGRDETLAAISYCKCILSERIALLVVLLVAVTWGRYGSINHRILYLASRMSVAPGSE
jgi:hypothetical protein